MSPSSTGLRFHLALRFAGEARRCLRSEVSVRGGLGFARFGQRQVGERNQG